MSDARGINGAVAADVGACSNIGVDILRQGVVRTACKYSISRLRSCKRNRWQCNRCRYCGGVLSGSHGAVRLGHRRGRLPAVRTTQTNFIHFFGVCLVQEN